ncbi:hypothetical protein PRIPAC_74919 [Pristionchus pacificus]|uniref:Uncharacterized protein n=1 Tax=Pristionchus pacificus TaxID=54126 RepID=A0A2A6CAC4_PRIPA|nr:hypothetical protein PRIPAC_74919 [Pristionchus pacificus]|eukprot:PDM75077.1 hypothetical protein PRIPAC_40458 [Pristionchus pacificus]
MGDYRKIKAPRCHLQCKERAIVSSSIVVAYHYRSRASTSDKRKLRINLNRPHSESEPREPSEARRRDTKATGQVCAMERESMPQRDTVSLSTSMKTWEESYNEKRLNSPRSSLLLRGSFPDFQGREINEETIREVKKKEKKNGRMEEWKE